MASLLGGKKTIQRYSPIWREKDSISYQISTNKQVFVMLSSCIGLKCKIRVVFFMTILQNCHLQWPVYTSLVYEHYHNSYATWCHRLFSNLSRRYPRCYTRPHLTLIKCIYVIKIIFMFDLSECRHNKVYINV